jgi:hypothetical protein
MGDTSFLFAKPSYIEGIARVIDLGSTIDEYNSVITPEQADFLSIRNDWEVIGEDIAIVIEAEERKSDTKGEQIELEFGKI